jgi:hypothetical protein
MAKKITHRTDDTRPGAGRPFNLCGKQYWAVPDHLVDEWQGPGEAVPVGILPGLAQIVQAQMMLGASRKDSEEVALEWLIGTAVPAWKLGRQ